MFVEKQEFYQLYVIYFCFNCLFIWNLNKTQTLAYLHEDIMHW